MSAHRIGGRGVTVSVGGAVLRDVSCVEHEQSAITFEQCESAVEKLRAANVPTLEDAYGRRYYTLTVHPSHVRRAKWLHRRLHYRGGKKHRAALRVLLGNFLLLELVDQLDQRMPWDKRVHPFDQIAAAVLR